MKYGIYAVAVVAFLISAFFVISYAAGYKIDITNRSLNQTGIISISSDGGDIYINNSLAGKSRVVKHNLIPGDYQVTIKKSGYFDWNDNIELDAGQAAIVNNVTLFLQNPQITNDTSDQPDFLTQFADVENLTVTNNEIYQNDNFVTRYSHDVFGVCWYPDQNYIALTTDNRLKIIGIDGTNEVSLLDKDSQSPVVFVNSGHVVIYENDSKMYRAQIR